MAQWDAHKLERQIEDAIRILNEQQKYPWRMLHFTVMLLITVAGVLVQVIREVDIIQDYLTKKN